MRGEGGRGAGSVTLAARIEAALARPCVVDVETIFQAGRATSQVTTFRAERHMLEAITRTLAALHCNARLRVAPDSDVVTWTTSEPLDT